MVNKEKQMQGMQHLLTWCFCCCRKNEQILVFNDEDTDDDSSVIVENTLYSPLLYPPTPT